MSHHDSPSAAAPTRAHRHPAGHAARHLQQTMHAAMAQLDALLRSGAAAKSSHSTPSQGAASPTPTAPPMAASIPMRMGVALSGGADSSAVLLAAVRQWPGQVRAVHVHHGLQAAADAFAAHCQALCDRLDVPLTIVHVQAQAAPGESPEAKARDARYMALAQWARREQPKRPVSAAPPLPADAPRAPVVLLGHHADDQVETVLLALSRGTGVAGLAGMAPMFERHGATFARPLLEMAAPDIRRWLQTQGLNWVEDPTNQDTRYTRNRIRHLLPALFHAFPQFRQTVARSARLCAQTSDLLLAQAQTDWQQVQAPDAALPPAPRIEALQALSTARQAQVLRHWLRTVHHTTPSEAQLSALLRLVAACRTRGHRIHLRVGRGHVLRCGEVLTWQPDANT